MINMILIKFQFLFICFLLFLCSYTNGEKNPCTGADETLELFEKRLNNIKAGNAVVVLLKNFYCPACTHYLTYWEAIQNGIKEIEGDNLTMITFDCACPKISPYCGYFNVEFYPTFRTLYPVSDINKTRKGVKYVNKGDMIAKTKYQGSFTIAYKEVDRMLKTINLQKMLQLEVCPQMISYGSGLISCSSDFENEEENRQIRKKIDNSGIQNLSTQIGVEKQDEKWAGIPKKEDIQHDIIVGMIHTLKQNVTMGKPVTKESLKTYIAMLNIIAKIYPNTEKSINELLNTINSYTYPITYETWREKLKNVKINEYQLDENNNFNFKVCGENSLFCSFWLLYHKVSVYCYRYDDKNYLFYKNLILEYTKKYLNCKNCIEHFSNTYADCRFGACNVHSAASLIIFLWRTHNAVTLRTTCEALEVSKNNNAPSILKKVRYANKDIAFPSRKQCALCREGYGLTKFSKILIRNCEEGRQGTGVLDAVDAFNILQTLRFLLNYFE